MGGMGGMGSMGIGGGMKGQEPAVQSCGCLTTSTFLKLVSFFSASFVFSFFFEYVERGLLCVATTGAYTALCRLRTSMDGWMYSVANETGRYLYGRFQIAPARKIMSSAYGCCGVT